MIVIASKTGGLVDQVINSYTGFTFKTGDAKDLADKIKVVLSLKSAQFFLLKNSKKLVNERYNYLKNVQSFIKSF